MTANMQVQSFYPNVKFQRIKFSKTVSGLLKKLFSYKSQGAMTVTVNDEIMTFYVGFIIVEFRLKHLYD